MGSVVRVSTEWGEPGQHAGIRRDTTARVFESTRIENGSGEKPLDPQPIAPSGLDQYLLLLCLAGSADVRCDDLSIRIRAGDIGIFELSRPFCAIAVPGAIVSLALPCGPLDQANKGKSLHGMVMVSERPLTRILADLILGTCKVASELTEAEALAVEESLLKLLVTGLAQSARDTPTSSVALMQTLRQQIIEFIEANLYERTLGPALLMQRYQISRAHLYRIFADIGGIAKIIRDRRLDAAYREIAGGSKAFDRSITELALHLGFSNSSQFARAFHRRFAMTPTEARLQGSHGSQPGGFLPRLQEHFTRYVVNDWLEDLPRAS